MLLFFRDYQIKKMDVSKARKSGESHSERSEESSIHAGSGFFAPLRYAQDDTFEAAPL